MRLRLGLMLAALLVAELSAQVLTAKTTGEELRVGTSGIGFLEGAVLERLRDGRSIRLEAELTVLDRPKGAALARDRKSFDVSLDLWEDRFAVTRLGSPPQSASHLTAADAETWCLEHLVVPFTALGGRGRDLPFWLRLDYRLPETRVRDGETDGGLTLRGLIDRLSRRPPGAAAGRTIEGGPFRWSR